MARMRDGVAARQFIISEADLEDFAKQVQAATATTIVTLHHGFTIDGEDAEALGQGLADFFQQYQGWMGDRVIGKGVELLSDADAAVTEEVKKIAVDTLYAAREDNRVMDQAAILVAANVLTRLEVEDQVIGYLRGRADTLDSEAALFADRKARAEVLTERASALREAAARLQLIADEEAS
jgi:hypothetical protein